MRTWSGARPSSRTGVLCAGSPQPSVTASRFSPTRALRSDREPYWPDAVPVDPDADAVLMFTSGTTSRPKAVRVTHGNIQANTDSIIKFLELRSDDRVLVILPFFYCYGASLLHTHLRCGGRVVLCNSFVFPETALDLLEREECTVLAGVPSSFQLLLRASTFTQRALPSLRLIQQAGGKLPPVLIEELLAAKPTAKLFVMYGQTEATARLSYLPPDKLPDKPGSIGKGIPGVELRVLDENGEPVPPGERGEIYATGANISPGYYDDPEGSAAKFTPYGLRTGDLAVVDEDGYIFIVDRRDDFIKSWGHRISSQEVEAAALRMEQLVSAAVDRRPGRRGGGGGHALRHGPARRRGHAGRGPRRLPPAPAEVHGAPLGADPGRVAPQREREDRQTAVA